MAAQVEQRRARRAPARALSPLAIALVVVLVAAACSGGGHAASPTSARSGTTTADRPVPEAPAGIGPLDQVVLTPDGFDTYGAMAGGRSMGVATGVANTDGNLRTIYVPRLSAETADQQVCATWTAQRGEVVQEGVALRVRPDAGAPGQALTVTKSVWGGVPWYINVHLWTGGSQTWHLELIQQFDVQPALERAGGIAPLPWRLCARAEGSVVSVKVWPADESEPSWDDPTYTYRTLVPPSTDQPGKVGWYVGHLRPGDSLRYDDMTVTAPS